MATSLAAEIEQYIWYHTIDLGSGVVTKGMFDHRAVVDRYLIPDDLSGLRCLDVGTMDGFWAFEMERRGAAEVIAADVDDPDELDWPPAHRARTRPLLDETKQARFGLVHRVLGSNVTRVNRSVYDLDPAELGTFDLIFCGDLLVHLKDPVSAIERLRHVCHGSTILCNPVTRFRFGRRRPLAEFDGLDEFQWWALSEAAIERIMRAVGFASVEVGPSFQLPGTGGGKWKGRRAVLRGYV
jgi:tRNA (mo5U34)-methyltransferase